MSIEKNKRDVSGFDTEAHQKNCEKVSNKYFIYVENILKTINVLVVSKDFPICSLVSVGAVGWGWGVEACLTWA